MKAKHGEFVEKDLHLLSAEKQAALLNHHMRRVAAGRGVVEQNHFTTLNFAGKDNHLNNLFYHIRPLYNWRRLLAERSAKKAKKVAVTEGPLVVFMCLSANVATDYYRAAKKLPGRLVKGFARHLKVEEQLKELEETVDCVGVVGTPNRLSKLADLGGIQFKEVKLLVIDVHRDTAKGFCLFDYDQPCRDMLMLLQNHCMEPLNQGTLKILLY